MEINPRLSEWLIDGRGLTLTFSQSELSDVLAFPQSTKRETKLKYHHSYISCTVGYPISDALCAHKATCNTDKQIFFGGVWR
jgi:hypothetical protein